MRLREFVLQVFHLSRQFGNPVFGLALSETGDPLFSDTLCPATAAPSVSRSLKSEAFSTYLHPLVNIECKYHWQMSSGHSEP